LLVPARLNAQLHVTSETLRYKWMMALHAGGPARGWFHIEPELRIEEAG
jgi:hypothetical protein